MNNIYIVGFMGTGKTTVSKELSGKKKLRFVDLDELIELRQKKTIADIFAGEGEPYFRRVEKQVLKEVAKENNFVVACGGGVVIDKENIRLMKETGVIVCLSATAEVILKRTSQYCHRPLLNVSDPKKRLSHYCSFSHSAPAQRPGQLALSICISKEITTQRCGNGVRNWNARRTIRY